MSNWNMPPGVNTNMIPGNEETTPSFDDLESDGMVRIQVFLEEENYFDVYGEPEGYTDTEGDDHTPEEEHQEICEQLEADGLWFYLSEYWDINSREWEHADSIGMVIGTLEDSGYLEDLQESAVAAYMNQTINPNIFWDAMRKAGPFQ